MTVKFVQTSVEQFDREHHKIVALINVCLLYTSDAADE